MRCVVITVAGRSERFNRDINEPRLKCIYFEQDKRKTLLYSMLKKCIGYDKVVVVGGYQYEVLQQYAAELEAEFPYEIELVYNPSFAEYGSGYSLYVGMQTCLKDEKCDEILFAEGDLAVDADEFERIKQCGKSCYTTNYEEICSKKSVVVYINDKDQIRYQYNTAHGYFVMKEPFYKMYNSGQIWKIADCKTAKEIMEQMPMEEWQDTNLKFIERYFNGIERDEIERIPLQYWVNCNSREDFAGCKGKL